MQARAIEEFSVVSTLAEVERLHALRIRAETETFVLATHFADLYAGDSLPRSREALPGMERAVRLGGEGTPTVAEFAAAEFGARIQLGTWAARRFIADALDSRHRLPRIWAQVVTGQARVGYVRAVAARTRHLTIEAAGAVDAAMADFVDGCLPWGRFDTRLDGVIVKADPDAAAAREAERMAVQFAKRTRASDHGTAGFYARSSAGVIARIDATIAYVADALKAFGDAGDIDRRRVTALVVLCNPTVAVQLLAAFSALRSRTCDVELPLEPPGEPPASEGPPSHDALGRMDRFARRVGFTPAKLPPWLGIREGLSGLDQPEFRFDWSELLPPLTLHLHLAAEDVSRGGEGVARWEGVGPVSHQFVHDHLRPLHSYRIQPVVDLAARAPVDGYEVPDRLRTAVHLRTPADCFPFSSDVGAHLDVDHTQPYDHTRGKRPQTRLDNLGPLGRFHHRIKTHGRWTVRQPFDGIYLWRDPHGQVYLVDHTGSRKITEPDAAAGPARQHDPDLELHPAGGLVVEVDLDDTA